MMPNIKSIQNLVDVWTGIEALLEVVHASRIHVRRIMAAATTGDIEQIQVLCRELMELTKWTPTD